MALKHYMPHGYATRYACGAKVKPGNGSSYSDEVTCQWCLEKLKIAREFGSLEGDFDIEDDMVGTAKRRYHVSEVRKMVREELRLNERRIHEELVSDEAGSLFSYHDVRRGFGDDVVRDLWNDVMKLREIEASAFDDDDEWAYAEAEAAFGSSPEDALAEVLAHRLGLRWKHDVSDLDYTLDELMRMAGFSSLIDAMVDEARLHERRIREAELSDGSKSPWGSEAHVKELRASITDLERYRNQQRRGSDARATYTRALQRLKAQLRSAENAAAKSGLKKRTRA